MTLSIVTISYNQSQFLEQAIQSVLNQTGPSVEYIMVDPGSTDGSRDIIERYRNHFARTLLERDNGPSDGLNQGFAAATGEIFGYLNSDDMFLPGALKRVAAIFSANPDVDVISGHAHVISGEGTLLRRAFSTEFSLRECAFCATSIIQPSTFFRASAFRRTNGFVIENRATWDTELLVDMALSGANFRLVNDFFSCYRLHAASITSSQRLRAEQGIRAAICFEKIMKRKMTKSDLLWVQWHRLKKHILYPRSTLERLRYGPISGRVS